MTRKYSKGNPLNKYTEKNGKNEEKAKHPGQRTIKLKPRQIKVLHGRVMGQKVREIATETGVSEATIWSDLKELRNLGITKNLIEQERQAHMKALPLATAVILAHLIAGDKDVAMNMVKGMRVWSDKIEVESKVEPGEQQKKFLERMETLLKLKTEPVAFVQAPVTQHACEAPNCAGDPCKEDPIMKEEIKPLNEAELREKQYCICDTLDHDDPNCPVHGSGQETGGTPTTPASEQDKKKGT